MNQNKCMICDYVQSPTFTSYTTWSSPRSEELFLLAAAFLGASRGVGTGWLGTGGAVEAEFECINVNK
jgi:hypothetical protein